MWAGGLRYGAEHGHIGGCGTEETPARGMKLQDVRTASELATLRDQIARVKDKLERSGRVTHLTLKLESEAEVMVDGRSQRQVVGEEIVIPLTDAPDPHVAKLMQALGAMSRAMLLRWIEQTSRTVAGALEEAGVDDDAG